MLYLYILLFIYSLETGFDVVTVFMSVHNMHVWWPGTQKMHQVP